MYVIDLTSCLKKSVGDNWIVKLTETERTIEGEAELELAWRLGT